MKRPIVRVGVLAAAAVQVVALSLAGTPASAVDCKTRSDAASAGIDAAWIMDISGGCQYVAVRHRYDPPWSGINYWTNWAGGSGWTETYFTTHNPVYYRHQTEHY